MTTPYSIAASLNLPGDTTLPAQPIPAIISGFFTSEASAVLNLTGSGTKSVDMGTVGSPGAKVLLVKVDPGVSVSPVQITLDEADTPFELSAGGFFLYANPTPAVGITSLDVAHTTACVVRVWVLG